MSNSLCSYKTPHTLWESGLIAIYVHSDFCMDAKMLLIDTSWVPTHRVSVQRIVSSPENASHLSLLVAKHQIQTPFQLTKVSFYSLDLFFLFPSSKGKSSILSCINWVLCKMEVACFWLEFHAFLDLKFASTHWVTFFWSVLWEQLLSSMWSFTQLFEI